MDDIRAILVRQCHEWVCFNGDNVSRCWAALAVEYHTRDCVCLVCGLAVDAMESVGAFVLAIVTLVSILAGSAHPITSTGNTVVAAYILSQAVWTTIANGALGLTIGPRVSRLADRA